MKEKIKIIAKNYDGCNECKDELIKFFTGVLESKSYLKLGYIDEDLIQDGLLNVVKAINNFDKSKGVLITTYITNTINHSTKKYLAKNVYYPKLSLKMTNEFMTLRDIIESGEYTDEQFKKFDKLSELITENDYNVKNIPNSSEFNYSMPYKITEDVLKNLLNEKEFDIFVSSALYGESRESIGKRYDTTRQNIDRIYKKICKDLRHYINKEYYV